MFKKLVESGVCLKNLANPQDQNVQPKVGGPISEMQDSTDSKFSVDFILQECDRDPRPYLGVKVTEIPIKALLDSGASRTILGRPGLKLLSSCKGLMQPTPTLQSIETADGKKHVVEGHCTLPISLEGRTRDIDVLVVPTLPQVLILGVDFWDRMHIITDIHNRTWNFAPDVLACSLDVTEGLHSMDHLSAEEKKILQALVDTYLGTHEHPLGKAERVVHCIDTGGASPIKQRYYPMSPVRLKLVYEELDKMLELQVVEPSHSPWSSPILLLDKPDGSHRFCVDFRRVNALTKPDAYPLPKVTTILDRLRDARYLTSMDIKSAYWHIPLHSESKEKTAFTVQGRGLFQFNRMPFGLHNAPATWQRYIDDVLGPELEPFVFVYLDDIILTTPTFEEHMRVLEEVLRRLKENNLILNVDKCKFCRSELKYLGYMVDAKGLRVDPEKVEAILKIPVPKNVRQIRQFTGTASWYRRFIPNFATRLHPLTSLLRKGKKFIWSDETQQAFEDIKSCLIKSPILACPNFEKPFTISCDASTIGLGAVLSQVTEDGGETVIAYASRTLTCAEQKYSATERECLGVIWAVEKFRPYVEGSKFTIVTDHYSLLWLHNLKDPQGRLARWALRLQPYNFDLVHRKGTEHTVPDMLSRLPQLSDIEPASILQLTEEVGETEPVDAWYRKMLHHVKEYGDRYPSWRAEGKILWKLVPDNHQLKTGTADWKKVVPKEQRAKVISEHHDAPTAGHLGVHKTLQRVQHTWYWPKMRQDISKYVARCKVCQQTKYSQDCPSGLLGSRRSVDQPWIMISADLIGPFPRSTRGYKYLLVVTDTFTKFTLLFPLRAATASSVAKHLEEEVFMVFGVPRFIICDNGPEFIGGRVKRLARDYKVNILFNASRHPQANPTERTNKTIVTMLRAYVGECHRQWDKHIPQLGFALRSAVHEVTGYSPAFLTFGRELDVSGEGYKICEDFSQLPTVTSAEGHAGRLQELQEVYRNVVSRLEKNHQKNARHYNLRRRHVQYDVGDMVWKKNFTQSNAAAYYSSKLAPTFVGPFRVSKKLSPLVYQLEDVEGNTLGKWHVSDLKPHTG